MKKRQHSKAGLFLIELMIVIAFFSVTAAVFLQAFARSHTISQEAEELFHAQSMASSVAEVLGGARGSETGEVGSADDRQDDVAVSGADGGQEEAPAVSGIDRGQEEEQDGQMFFRRLAAYFPETEPAQDGGGAYIYCDENWNICAAGEERYTIVVRWQRDGSLWEVDITAGGTKETSGKLQEAGRGTAQDGDCPEEEDVYRLELKLYDPQMEGGTS